MQPRAPLPLAAIDLARDQAGVLTRPQLLDLGLSRRSIDRLSRDWRHIHRGIFDTSPMAGDLTWLARVHAALLLAGDGALACRRTAAHITGLLEDAPPVIEVLVRTESRFDRHPGVVFVRERSAFRRTAAPTWPPSTSVEDTVLDLTDGATGRAAVMWCTRAVQRRLTTPDRLLEALALRRRHAVRDALKEILGDVAEGAETVMEVRYLRDVEAAHGLPVAGRQVRTVGGVSDVVYGDLGVIVELDGVAGHGEEGRFADHARDNRNALVGAVTLRFGYVAVTDDACATAREVAAALRRGGWRGAVRPCPRCA